MLVEIPTGGVVWGVVSFYNLSIMTYADKKGVKEHITQYM
jgi:hypothetical protein